MPAAVQLCLTDLTETEESKAAEAPPPPEKAATPNESSKSRLVLPTRPIKSVCEWGVKDRTGGWLLDCVPKALALRFWEEEADAYELYRDRDPWDCLLPEAQQKNPMTLVARKDAKP